MNAVYFASGPIREQYLNYPFEKLYLVDNIFKGIQDYGKIITIGLDCLDAVDYLSFQKIKIDCIISINEGLWEGGGYYKINSDAFFGYVWPLLNDTFYHLYDPTYYNPLFKNYEVDLPSKATKIDDDSNPLHSKNLSFSRRTYKLFENQKDEPFRRLQINGIVVNLINSSIWVNFEKYNKVFLKFKESAFVSKLKKRTNITLLANNFQIAGLEVLKGRIAFTTGLFDSYEALFEKIKGLKNPDLKQVDIYFLNKKDWGLFTAYLD